MKTAMIGVISFILLLIGGLNVTGCGEKEEQTRVSQTAGKEERELPSIVITEPRFTGLNKVSEPIISLAGLTVKDLESVDWQNDRGGGGVARGTINWRVPEVLLQPGVNTITISAKDKNSGEIYTSQLSITYEPVELLGELRVRPDTIYIDEPNEMTVEITVKPDPRINRDKVEIYRIYEDGKNMYLLGLLTDDGSIDSGDQTAGDGVWASKFTLTRGTESQSGLKRVGQTADELSILWGLADRDVGRQIRLRVSTYLLEDDGSYTTTSSNIVPVRVEKR